MVFHARSRPTSGVPTAKPSTTCSPSPRAHPALADGDSPLYGRPRSVDGQPSALDRAQAAAPRISVNLSGMRDPLLRFSPETSSLAVGMMKNSRFDTLAQTRPMVQPIDTGAEPDCWTWRKGRTGVLCRKQADSVCRSIRNLSDSLLSALAQATANSCAEYPARQ